MNRKHLLMVLLCLLIACWLTAPVVAEGRTQNVVRTLHFSYDAAGRLTGADDTSGGGLRYTYDVAGNLLRRGAPGMTPSLALPLIWR